MNKVNLLNILKIKNKQASKRIRSTGSKWGETYGLTKVHKPENSLSPIISTIGRYNYLTAKYLAEILENYLSPTFKYVIKDNFDFVNR